MRKEIDELQSQIKLKVGVQVIERVITSKFEKLEERIKEESLPWKEEVAKDLKHMQDTKVGPKETAKLWDRLQELEKSQTFETKDIYSRLDEATDMVQELKSKTDRLHELENNLSFDTKDIYNRLHEATEMVQELQSKTMTSSIETKCNLEVVRQEVKDRQEVVRQEVKDAFRKSKGAKKKETRVWRNLREMLLMMKQELSIHKEQCAAMYEEFKATTLKDICSDIQFVQSQLQKHQEMLTTDIFSTIDTWTSKLDHIQADHIAQFQSLNQRLRGIQEDIVLQQMFGQLHC